MRISVVLPAPFSPSKAWISPGRKVKSTWLLANTVLKRLLTPRIATTGSRSLVISSHQHIVSRFQDTTPWTIHLGYMKGQGKVCGFVAGASPPSLQQTPYRGSHPLSQPGYELPLEL